MASEASEPGSESGKRSDDRRGVPEGTPQEGGASTPLAAPGSLAAAAIATRVGAEVGDPPVRAEGLVRACAGTPALARVHLRVRGVAAVVLLGPTGAGAATPPP